MLAYDYPLLGLFWTMLWFFLWIAWLVALFQIIGDIFNSDDLGGWGKALWLIFVIATSAAGRADLPDRPWRRHATTGDREGPGATRVVRGVLA